MTPQLENAITIAQSLSVEEQRELLSILSELVDGSQTESELSANEIAASLERAIHEVKTGQTKPIAQLWDSLDAE
jgi:hypothetical protein